MRSLLVLCSLLFVNVVRSRAQLSTVDMSQVVSELAGRFEAIRNDGLGIPQLEEEYRRAARFNFDTLTQAHIDQLMTGPTLNNSVNSVINLFNSINSIVANSNTTTLITPEDCCSNPMPSVCCFDCDSSDTQLRDQIAGAFSEHNVISGGGLYFGFNEGSLIQRPLPTGNCTVMDSRLQQWYRRTLSRPLEVVIVMDGSIRPNQNFYSESDIDRLEEVAMNIIRSLTQQDRVAVVRADRLVMLPGIVRRLSPTVEDMQTVAICDDVFFELEQFITSTSQVNIGASVNLTDSFLTGAGLFTDDPNKDKVFVTLLPGLSPVGLDDASSFLSAELTRRGLNNVYVSSYRGIDDGVPQTRAQIGTLLQSGIPGVDITLRSFNPSLVMPPLVTLAGMFYPLPTDPPMSTAVVTGRTTNSQGVGVLTISQPLTNGSHLIGVLYAELPWQQLLADITSQLSNRASSYSFAFDSRGLLLFHPLLPSSVLKDVSLNETENELSAAVNINNLSTTSTVTAPIDKRLLIDTRATEEHGFVVRVLRANYHCRRSVLFNLCLMIADEDVTVSTLDNQSVNVGGIYTNQPVRRPLYHDLSRSAPSASTCDYFCKATITDRISYQLTAPSSPPANYNPSTVSDYIESGTNRPSWVSEGVASELALGSVVATSWVDQGSSASDYITRRHLATPSGAYLTYPPTQFVSNFRPHNTPWYTSAEAHPSLLTLTPPEVGLREGSRLTVSASYAVRTPVSERDNTLNGGQTLSVVAADLTLDAIRSFIRQALPLCERGVTCLLIDDLGNIIYDETLVNSPVHDGSPMFFGRTLRNNPPNAIQWLITRLLNQQVGLLTKQECQDYFVIGVEARRFYSLDTSRDDLVTEIGADGLCIDYMLQRVPGTNAFMVAIEDRGCFSSFCPCTGTCNNCNTFLSTGCECPCSCGEDCSTRPFSLTCPSQNMESANYEVVPTTVTTNPMQGTCFNQNCNCRTTQNSCLGARECSWCPTEEKCVYLTECCDPSSPTCCNSSPQLDRFDLLTCGLSRLCETGPVPTSTCPQNNTAVVAGVVGGICAVILLGLIVALIVWYQVFRREDPKEETSRESAFDFSSKRTQATNPTSSDVQSQESSNHKSNVENTPSASVDGATNNEKTDSTTL